MNRFPAENTRYVFRPPKYSKFWASLLYPVSELYYRKKLHRVVSVKVAAGSEELLRLYRQGASLLLTPNHSDHCDPQSLMHLSRRFKMPVNFMAARETFDKYYGINGFVIQRMGAFSVDREGSDIAAIKAAMTVLYEAKYPLVMFPEGEIYHLNEKLTPLNEGAATLALRAARKTAQDKPGHGAYIIPVAMKYRYIDDISPTFPERMSRLESMIMWRPQSGMGIVDRIYKFGEAVLALKEKEYLDGTLTGSLDERLKKFRDILVREQEKKYLGKIQAGHHPARIRKVRGKIRSILLSETDKPTQAIMDECSTDLDRLFMAVKLYSYPGQYLREKPSMDRIAETIHKFEEDATEFTRIYGRRNVEVTFCKPIDLMGYLDAAADDQKAAVADVTSIIESEIRSVLE